MRSDVHDFLQGYLNARGNAGSSVEDHEDFAIVRYRMPMGRTSELFYWGSRIHQLPLEPGMWLTIIGSAAGISMPGLYPPMLKVADEYLMRADLPLDAKAGVDTNVVEIRDPETVRSFNRSNIFAKIPSLAADREQAAYFRLDDQGTPAAAGRFGWSRPDLVVADHVLTLPAFRRRGLGEALMAAMAANAIHRGARRMLLISSEEGRRLYERIGFQLLAHVTVYEQSDPVR